MKLPLVAIAASLLIATAGTVHADVIRLKNGDTLTGKVLSRDGGKIRLKANLYGEVTINESDVASFKIGENVTAADVQAPPAGAVEVSAPPPAAGAPATATAAGGGSTNFQGQKSDPNKPVWTRTLSFGGNYNSPNFEQGQLKNAPPGATGALFKLPGRTYSFMASAVLMRATQSDVHSLEFTKTIVDSEPQGKQVDTYSGVLAWNHKITDRTYTLSRTSYMVDNVKNIDYSASQIFGYGFKVVDGKQLKFDLVPGVLLQKEKKGNRFDDEVLFGAGFLESLTYYFNAFASFEQKVLFRRAVKYSDVYIVDAYAGFKGMLSAQLGVTVGFTYVYDNTLGPLPAPFSAIIAQKKGVLQTNYGLQYKY